MPSQHRNKVFISYSHLDKKFLDAVKTALAPLERDNRIIIWDDTKIHTGADWKKEIQEALDTTSVAVMLVSQNFLASKFISEVELPALLNSVSSPGIKVCWVLISSCMYERSGLEPFQASHDISKPLDTLSSAKRRKILTDIARQIDSLANESPSNSQRVDYSQEDLRKYLEFIIAKCSTLDPRRIPRGSKTHDIVLPLRDVYISLRAGQNNPLEREAEQNLLYSDARDFLNRIGVSDGDFLSVDESDFRYQILTNEADLLSKRQLDNNALNTLTDVFCKNRWLTILGDPGSGKTTLLQWLALNFAEAMLSGLDRVVVEKTTSSTDKLSIDLGPIKLPVLVRIADYANELNKQPSLRLIDYLGLQPIFGQYSNLNPDSISNIVKFFLVQKKALILLDGLDEVIYSSDRGVIRDKIEEFVGEYIKDPVNEKAFSPWSNLSSGEEIKPDRWWESYVPSRPDIDGGSQVVITSRIAGYKAAVLRNEFAHYVIESLDDDTIKNFCNDWSLAVERYLSRQLNIPIIDNEIEIKASKESESLISIILNNKSVRKLAINPLMLTLLALVHREQSRLPTQRVRLYKQAVEILIHWRDLPNLDEAFINDVLGPFAVSLHENQPSGLATESELKQSISSALARWHGLGEQESMAGKLSQDVDTFISMAREQSGLLVARGQGLYGFMHLTFQEYFVARELTRDPNKVIENILVHLHQPRWQEALLFAIAYVSDSQRGMLERVLQSILSAKADYEEILNRNVFFVAACIEESVWTPPSIVRQVSEKLIGIYASSEEKKRFRTLQNQVVIAFDQMYKTDTARVVEDVLIKHLLASDSSYRNAVSNILSRTRISSGDIPVALYKALRNSSDDSVAKAFEIVAIRNSNSSSILPQYSLAMLSEVYEKEPILLSMTEKAENAKLREFLSFWDHRIHPYIIPVIVDCLKFVSQNFETSNKSEVFFDRLEETLVKLIDNNSGFVYQAALEVLVMLEGRKKSVEVIKKNLSNSVNVRESVDLYLSSFLVDFKEMDDLRSWWANLPLIARQCFFESKYAVNVAEILEEIAWLELSTQDSSLTFSSLTFLLKFSPIVIDVENLKAIKFLVANHPNQENLASDILEHATLDLSSIKDVQVELLEWFQSSNDYLKNHAAILLTSIDYMSEDIYDVLDTLLGGENERFRQWAEHVLVKPRLASQLPPRIIEKACQDAASYTVYQKTIHSQFSSFVIHDNSDLIIKWVNFSENEKELSEEISCKIISSIRWCTQDCLQILYSSLNSQASLEMMISLTNALSWIGSYFEFDGQHYRQMLLQKDYVDTLLSFIKFNDNDDALLNAATGIGRFVSDRQYALDALMGLLSLNQDKFKVVAAHGLSVMVLNTSQSLDIPAQNIMERISIRNVLTDTFKKVIQDDKTQHSLRSVMLGAYVKSLLVGVFSPEEIYDGCLDFTSGSEELLDAFYLAGVGDDVFDSIVCDCGKNYHTKLLSVIKIAVRQYPLLFESVVERCYRALELPENNWDKVRIPIGAFAGCSEEFPAKLSQLASVDELQKRLLVGAKNSSSFNVRRFSIVALCQFRVINSEIIKVLSLGCQDAAVVQASVLDAVSAFRLIEDINAVSGLVDMLNSPSTITVYAVALIMRRLGNSRQALSNPELRKEIGLGLEHAILNEKYPRYIWLNGRRLEKIEDVLFNSLVQIAYDDIDEDVLNEKSMTFNLINALSMFGSNENRKHIQAQAVAMQNKLRNEILEFEDENYKVVLSADQVFMRIETSGAEDAELLALLNNAIKNSQIFAAEMLKEFAAPINRQSVTSQIFIQNMREQARIMQKALQQKKLESMSDSYKIIVRGDQFIEFLTFKEQEKDDLRAILNKAIKQSQLIAADYLQSIN